MTHDDDTAALVAAARAYAGKARRVMSEINAEPPLYVAYLDRLAAALEAATADRARLRGIAKRLVRWRDDPYSGALHEVIDAARAALGDTGHD